MLQNIDEAKQIKAITRRMLLTRDLRAICAMSAVPLLARAMFPERALARDGRDSWNWERDDRDYEHHERPEHEDRGERRLTGFGSGKCFLRGTKIMTASGERNVEDLALGDLVPTVFGGLRPVQWIGRFSRSKVNANRPWSKEARPVRIARSALASDVPHTDLFVTQGHALLLNDVLVPAGSLINGTTIALYPANEHEKLDFFHIKLETHDVIYAQGAPCETLLQTEEAASDTASQLLRWRKAPEAEQLYCAPVICNGQGKELAVRLRSLLSPWLGLQKFDEIRARLELRAMAA